MKKIRYTLPIMSFMAATMLLGTCSGQDKGESFIFVQISDPQFGFREKEAFQKAQANLEKALDSINVLRPDFVIVTGDMVNMARNEEQLSAFSRTMSRISEDIPVYYVPGNHDMGEYGSESLEHYLSLYGYDRFSFSHKGCAFIGINSCPIRENDTPVEEEQFSWLEKQLKKYRKLNQRLIFLHCPVAIKDMEEKDGYSNFPTELRGKYTDLFRKYDVNAVIAGHLHYSTGFEYDGVDYITTGPCGLPLANGKSGFALFTISGKKHSFEYILL